MKEVAAIHALKSTIRKFKILNIELNKNILLNRYIFFFHSLNICIRIYISLRDVILEGALY